MPFKTYTFKATVYSRDDNGDYGTFNLDAYMDYIAEAGTAGGGGTYEHAYGYYLRVNFSPSASYKNSYIRIGAVTKDSLASESANLSPIMEKGYYGTEADYRVDVLRGSKRDFFARGIYSNRDSGTYAYNPNGTAADSRDSAQWCHRPSATDNKTLKAINRTYIFGAAIVTKENPNVAQEWLGFVKISLVFKNHPGVKYNNGLLVGLSATPIGIHNDSDDGTFLTSPEPKYSTEFLGAYKKWLDFFGT